MEARIWKEIGEWREGMENGRVSVVSEGAKGYKETERKMRRDPERQADRYIGGQAAGRVDKVEKLTRRSLRDWHKNVERMRENKIRREKYHTKNDGILQGRPPVECDERR